MNDQLPHDPTELAAALHDAVADVHAAPDAAEVHRRLATRRRRLAAGGTALAAVAALAAGLVWPDAPPQQIATTDRHDRGSTATRPPGAAGSAPAAAAFPGAEQLQRRVTAAGLELTTNLIPGQLNGWTNYWTPPESCRSLSGISVEVHDPTQATALGLESLWYEVGHDVPPADVVVSARRSSALFVSDTATGEGGAVESAHTTVTIAGDVVGSDPGGAWGTPVPGSFLDLVSVSGRHVRAVTARFATGGRDQAETTHGTTALAARVPEAVEHDASTSTVSLEVTLDDGRVLHLDDLSLDGGTATHFDLDGTRLTTDPASTTVTTTPPAGCTPPPPPLPAPGNQPADPTARDQVVAAMSSFIDGSKSAEEHGAAMVDPDLGRKVVDELGAGYSAVASTAAITVKDLVFTSPTEAVVWFSLDLTPSGTEPMAIPSGFFHDRFGKVVLRDGRWLVTPETLCSLTSAATPAACAGFDQLGEYPAEVFGAGGTANPPPATTTTTTTTR